MDIEEAGTANGTTVDLYDCNNTAAQVFIPQSGRWLDDIGYGGSGTQLQVWDCTGSTNQVWKLA
jgi:chitinase